MRWIRFLTVIIVVLFYLGTQFTDQPALAQGEPGPVVLESNEAGLSLVWTPPVYQLTPLKVDGEEYSQLALPGTTPSGRPGHPELPQYSRLIGLPASGGARLQVVEVEREVVSLPQPPLPALVPQPVSAASLDPQSPPGDDLNLRLPDPAIYSTDAFYPTEVASLGPVEQVRDQRVVRLTITPLRVNPVAGQMEIIRYLRLKISFERPATGASVFSSQAGSNPFDLAFAATLINPQAAQWPAASLSTSSLAAESLSDLPSNSLKVKINTPGLYALTYNDLAAAGVAVGSLDPRTLRLSHGWPRQEVAVWVEGETDGVFHPIDRLLFYAEPTFSRYVDYDIYFLSYGQGNGLRMGSRSANPAGLPAGIAWHTVIAEMNQFYDSHYPGRDGDYWYWDNLRQPDRTSATYTLPLASPLTTGPAASLTLWLQSYTDPAPSPDHRLAVAMNNTAVGEKTWNGVQTTALTFTVPAAGLVAGTSQVRLSLPGLNGLVVEGSYVDALALTYPLGRGNGAQLIFQGETGKKAYTLTGWPGPDLAVYDITDPAQPDRLTGYTVSSAGPPYTLTLGDANTTPARYLVAPDNQLKSPLTITPVTLFSDPAHGADYIIITHSNFAQAIAPLAAHRASQGWRVVTVGVQTIYDTFGSGRLDPAAIKTFLQHAYSSWPTPVPTYVLLVGDGSYDFKNYSGYNPSTFIPPYLAHVDPWWGETAADNRYVTLVGDDPLPDMLIGRLAVKTPAEATTVVNKIIRYETAPTPGDWNARQLFVADNPDSAGNFHADSDQGYNQVQPPFTGQRFYYSRGSSDQDYIYTDADALRTAFLNSFNYGANLITFTGHSSWLQWAQEGLLQYYPSPYAGPDDLAALHNQDRLPVILELTCFTGSFHRPEVATLDESLLNLSGGGAVAVWGSTGLGVSTGHSSLQKGFYQTIYRQGPKSLGAATLAGQMELYATGFHQDLLDTFVLFGDPALNLNLTITPLNNRVYLPIIMGPTGE